MTFKIDPGLQAFMDLTAKSPRAAKVLMFLASAAGGNNAVVANQKALAASMGCSARTLSRALDLLEEEHWICRLSVGGNATAYLLNEGAKWEESPSGIRLASFSATVFGAHFEDGWSIPMADVEAAKARLASTKEVI
jgi:hypothetical protein